MGYYWMNLTKPIKNVCSSYLLNCSMLRIFFLLHCDIIFMTIIKHDCHKKVVI